MPVSASSAAWIRVRMAWGNLDQASWPIFNHTSGVIDDEISLYLFTALNFNENRVWKKGWTKSSLSATVR